MAQGWSLPDTLRGKAFTTAEARAAGVGRRRLRSDRARQVHHGVWRDAETELSLAERCRVALQTSPDQAWISHASGATLLDLPLPPSLRELELVDVTVPAPSRAPRAVGIRGRQRVLDEDRLQTLDGMRVVTPAQAFVDGCDYLGFDDLVALGDALVLEGQARTEISDLIDAIDAHEGRRGHTELLRAAHYVHPRARSRPESIHRLALRALGTLEPWCNVPVLIDDGDAISPDVAFWQARLVIEVEGDHHRTDRTQWLVDLERYNRLQRVDVEVHRVVVTTPAATRQQLRPIVERIRARWDDARPMPPIAPWFDGEPLLGSASWLPLGG